MRSIVSVPTGTTTVWPRVAFTLAILRIAPPSPAIADIEGTRRRLASNTWLNIRLNPSKDFEADNPNQVRSSFKSLLTVTSTEDTKFYTSERPFFRSEPCGLVPAIQRRKRHLEGRTRYRIESRVRFRNLPMIPRKRLLGCRNRVSFLRLRINRYGLCHSPTPLVHRGRRTPSAR